MNGRFSLLPALAATILLVSLACGLGYKQNTAQVQEELLTESMARNDLRAKQLADSVAQQTVALIRLFDMALLQLRESCSLGGPNLETLTSLIRKSLPEGSVNLVLITDTEGKITYSSDRVSEGSSIDDRPYFTFFARGGQDQTFIASPFQGRLGEKKWVIPLVRAIYKDGKFAGVVVIGLRPEYLSAALASLSLDSGDIVALVTNDGSFLARNHSLTEVMGHKVAPDRPFLNPSRSEAETFRATSWVDNIPVNFAWKRLSQWPLVVVVGLDERAELAPIQTAIKATAIRSDLAFVALMIVSAIVAGLLLWAQRQQRKIAASEARFRLLFNGGNDCIWVHALDPITYLPSGHFLEVNDVACQRLGYSQEELLRMGPWDIDSPKTPTDKVDDLEDKDWAVFERIHVTKSGVQIPVEINARKINYRGEIQVLAICRDITERKHSEEKIRQLLAYRQAILSNTPIGIAIYNFDRCCQEANDAFARIFGIKRKDLLQMDAHQLYGDEAVYQDIGTRAYPLVRQGQTFVAEVPMRHQQGEDIWVRQVAHMIDINAPDLGVIWAMEDVSERKALELDLKRANAELEQFAYVASHDMRQPLRMVTSYLGLIEKRLRPQFDDDLREFFAFAAGGAKDLDRLIVDLLEYSRIGKSREVQPLPLAEIINRAQVNLTVAIEDSKAEIILPQDLPTLSGDPTELTRLFQNLIGNAIKYSAEERCPRIEIRCQLQGRDWRIEVKDNGIGIAPEDRERAFAVFQRLRAKQSVEGTGIGLAVCRKIVEHHGGRIWVESEPGVGSSFLFTLPA